MDDLPQYLTRRQAAAFLKARGFPWTSPATLAKYSTTGEGPPFRKCGRATLYTPEDLLTWARARLGPVRRRNADHAGHVVAAE